MSGPEGGTPNLLDPLELADEIMSRRATLAEQWQRDLEAVPEQMLDLKRSWLARTSDGI